MWSKIIDPRISISRRWLLRPLLDASFAQQRPIQRLCAHCTARAAIYSVVTMMSDDVKAGHSPRGGGRGAVASAWPLMRNWDHGRGYSEQWEICGRASFPRKMREIIVTYIVYWIKWQHKCWNEDKEIKAQINYKYREQWHTKKTMNMTQLLNTKQHC